MTPTTAQFPQIPLKDMDPSMLIFQLGHHIDRIGAKDSHGQNMLMSAMEIASYLHANQTRRNRGQFNRTPYVEHLLRVTLRLARMGLTQPEVLTAALLHDALEDCSDKIEKDFCNDNQTAQEWICESYGDSVAEFIIAVTNKVGQSYDEKIAELVSNASIEAILIKASDMCDNAGSLLPQMDSSEKSIETTTRLARKYLPALGQLQQRLENETGEFDRVSADMAVRLGQVTTVLEEFLG